MKKKFILIFSMVALVVCLFALSISASTYFYGLDSVDGFPVDDAYVNSWTANNMFEGEVRSEVDYFFGFGTLYLGNNGPSEGVYVFYVSNIDDLHEYLVSKDIDTFEDFSNLPNIMYDDGLIPFFEEEDGTIIPVGDFINGYFENDKENLWNAYQSYLEEISAPTYEQGKTDGVTEYKTSNEYYGELNKQYVQGKTEGVEAYKNSSEYKNAMNAKYSTGLADGKANYIESDEYEEALQAEYDKALDEAQSEKLGTTLLSVVGSTLLGVGIVWVFNRFSSKRKRRR